MTRRTGASRTQKRRSRVRIFGIRLRITQTRVRIFGIRLRITQTRVRIFGIRLRITQTRVRIFGIRLRIAQTRVRTILPQGTHADERRQPAALWDPKQGAGGRADGCEGMAEPRRPACRGGLAGVSRRPRVRSCCMGCVRWQWCACACACACVLATSGGNRSRIPPITIGEMHGEGVSCVFLGTIYL
jgi:hypothetical protein